MTQADPGRDDEVAATAEIRAWCQREVDGILSRREPPRYLGAAGLVSTETHAAPLITTGSEAGPAGRMTPLTTFVAGSIRAMVGTSLQLWVQTSVAVTAKLPQGSTAAGA